MNEAKEVINLLAILGAEAGGITSPSRIIQSQKMTGGESS
jgi:hypothetical protein